MFVQKKQSQWNPISKWKSKWTSSWNAIQNLPETRQYHPSGIQSPNGNPNDYPHGIQSPNGNLNGNPNGIQSPNGNPNGNPKGSNWKPPGKWISLGFHVETFLVVRESTSKRYAYIYLF